MKKQKKKFVYDTLLQEENICNLTAAKKRLLSGMRKGDKILVYGKRNTGKTSLIKNVIIPAWLKKNSSGFFLYADLMGVRTLEHISERITIAFNEGYSRAFNIKSTFKSALKHLKGIRPTMTIGLDGNPSFSFATDSGEKIIAFTDIFRQITTICGAGISALIVLDEFQDISGIDQAEALLRDSLQKLSSDVPVILLGSKQHMLSNIFSRPGAPFFNWGYSIEFSDIPYDEYWDYMNERFEQYKLLISKENSRYLQDLLQRSPEPINRLCSYLIDIIDKDKREIKKNDIDNTLSDMIAARQSEPEVYLASFSIKEQKVIIAIAKKIAVLKPTGKEFVAKTGLSMSGIRKIVSKLEDDAVIYREKNGISLADPLLRHHILKYRI